LLKQIHVDDGGGDEGDIKKYRYIFIIYVISENKKHGNQNSMVIKY